MQILLIGCGAMGGALVNGWKHLHAITIVDPFIEGGIKSIEFLPQDYYPDVVVIAVKPQALADILPPYARYENSLFISIAAGVKSERYKQWLNKKARVIRVMPNLPVMVGQGASAYISNENCSIADNEIVSQLFETVGICEQLASEDMFDTVTALSGSGPAYIYYLCECLQQAAVDLGMDKNFAENFAKQTIFGAALTLKELPESAANLRSKVTSKGGTTEAALNVLMNNNNLQNLFTSALKAASERAQELAL